jgi:sodium transport system permease protein
MLRNFPGQHEALQTTLLADKTIELTTTSDPVADIRRGELDALVDFHPSEDLAAALAGNFRMEIIYDESRDQSRQAHDRINERTAAYRTRFIEDEAVKAGLDRSTLKNFRVEEQNVSTGRQMGQFIMGLMLPMMIVIMLAVGSFYPAVDSTAGERENSTWETLMTVATSRTNIVVAKYLYVATMSFIAAFLNLVAMLFSLRGIIAPLVSSAGATMTFLMPWRAIPIVLAGAVLVALFIAAMMMILAAFARTFREGQSMVSPLYIALVIPVTFLQNPNQALTPGMAVIPLVNVVLMFREAIIGTYQWSLICVTLAVEALFVFLALRLAVTVLRHEDVVLGSYSGALGTFHRQRILPGSKR